MASNFKQGWSEVGGKTIWFRSGFEVRWARYLEFLKQASEFYLWQYEPKKFEFEGIRSGTVFYTPDFLVHYENNKVYWHECKGYLQQKDLTKWRRMKKYYPCEKIILVMQRIPSYNNRSKSAKRTKILLEKASRCVERVIDGSEILKKVGL